MSTHIEFETLNNTRDLGGMRTTDGRHIAPGRLFRSGHLAVANDTDLRQLAGMIHTVIDFRTAGECAENPDPAIPGVKHIHLPIMDTLTPGVTREADADAYALENLVKSPEASLRYMSGIYEAFAASGIARKGYSTFIDAIFENGRKSGDSGGSCFKGGVLWHCTAGKDRAGMGSAIVEKLLGVSDDDVYEDYLQTNLFITKQLDELYRLFVPENDGDNLAMEYLFTARREYIDTFFGTVRKLYGNFDEYARKALGVDDDKRRKLREMYLV